MTPDEIRDALADYFDPADIGWKPQTVNGNRAMAVAYLSAQAIQDRLDRVLGVAGWQDDYTILADGSVVCRLSVKIGDEWISRSDVGGQSKQPDGGDRMKSAFSNALKRAAVKFGIGRYLYRFPKQWCDFDSQKKWFVNTPRVPDQFLPRGSKPQPQPQRSAPAPQPQQQPQQPQDGGPTDKDTEYAKRLCQALDSADTIARYDEISGKMVWARVHPAYKERVQNSIDGAKDRLAAPVGAY